MLPKLPGQTHKSGGFTLVEIMIVVVIIGLLAAMAVPAFQKVRTNSYAMRIANDFRIFAGGFEIHALEVGVWPSDGMGNSLPPSAQPYFENTSWYEPAPNGGYWDWEVGRLGVVAAVGLSQGDGNLDIAVFMRVDEILDDGNLGTGQFIRAGSRYAYVLEH
jgi:prepilin-type N-terminal cleavage/methylation domain-containing protein